VDESYGAEYARLYRTHWWWRAREEYLSRILDSYLKPGEAGEALDFGCGDGLFFDVLRKFGAPSGIEPHGELLDPLGPWRGQITTEELKPDSTQRGRFGLVVALDVLEHLQDPAAAAAELARRTRVGGLWLVTVPAFQSLWTKHDDLNQHVKRYNRAELRALLEGAGLEVFDLRYFFAWTAFGKVAVRLREAVLPSTPEPPRVPPAPINSALLALSRVEQRILGSHSAPFGSSLLAVARLSRGAPPSP
jgi:SAM-dependent methyltransferase